MSIPVKSISIKHVARKLWLFLFLSVLSFSASSAGTQGAFMGNVKAQINGGFTYFEDNKGQLQEKIEENTEKALFISKGNGVNISFYKKKLVFQFSSSSPGSTSESSGIPEGNNNFKVNTLELVLENASDLVSLSGQEPLSFYKNYYLDGLTVLGLHPYRKLVYQNLYPGIDMEIASLEGGIKYSFIVHPGGDPSLIALRWHGTMPENSLTKGNIVYRFPLGNITEEKPISFTKDGKSISSQFYVKGNLVKFKLGYYSKTDLLIIDPVIKWSTYYGGTMGTPTSATTDFNGNLIVAGYTSSAKNIASSLAYQSSFGGTAGADYDAFVASFNSSGTMLWATYYGGTQDDIAKKVVTDNVGNIWFCGYTQSTTAISTTSSYQPRRAQGKSGAANYDAFLVKLNPGGYRIWGTYYGGNGDDMAQGLAYDNAGNVYMSGSTLSDSAISTSSSFQVVYDPSGTNAFLAKFNNSGILSWATYYGRTNNEVKVATDVSGTAYITGTGGANPSTGAFQTKTGSAFLTRFSSSGTRLWGTFFGGGTNDIPADIATDLKGNVLFVGATGSKSNIASPGVCFNLYNGDESSPGDGFIAKFDSSGGRIWSEYFGGSQNDAFLGIGLDSLGNIYGTGFTRSKTNIATPDAYEKSYNGSSGTVYGDAFVAKFAPSGSLQWSTYYGGSDDDAGLAITMDKKANLYLVGYTTSSSGIATSGSMRSTYSGSGDGFIAKFNAPFCSFTPAVTCVNKVCPGSTFGYSATYHAKDKYNWGGTGGTIVAGQYNDTVLIKWDTSGVGVLKVIETGQFGCKDSISVYVTKFRLPKAVLNGANNVCAGSSETYNASSDTTYSYRWIIYGGTIQSQLNGSGSIDVKWGNSGKGWIKLIVSNTNGCIDSLTDSIKINPRPRIQVYPSGKICKGTTVNLGADQIFDYTYNWYSRPSGFLSNKANPQVSIYNNVNYYLEIKDTSTGCVSTDSIVLTVKPKPYPKALGSNTVCSGSTIYYSTKPTLGNTYYWKVKNGRFISRVNTSQCQISWDSVGAGSVMVYETNTYGCTDSSIINVKVNPVPKIVTGQDKAICHGSMVDLGTNAISGHSYSWYSLPAGFSSSSATINVKPERNTTYYLLEQDSVTGCSITDSMHISIYRSPDNLKIKGNAIACASTILTYETPLDSGFESKWKLANGSIVTGQGNNTVKVIWDSNIAGTILLYKINAAGCKDSATKDVNVLAAPYAYVGLSGSICLGQSIQLGGNAQSGFSYSWSSMPETTIGSSSNPTVSPVCDTKYVLKVTNNISGCTKADTVEIRVLSLPNVTISGNTTYCVGDAASFSVKKVQGNTYKWKVEGGTIVSGATTEKIGVHWDSPGENGYVRTIVVNANGCLDSTTLPVNVNPLPDTTILGKTDVCQKGIYVYSSQQSKGYYTWKIDGGIIISGQNTSTITVQWTNSTSGIISLQVMNVSGCISLSKINVQIANIPTPSILGQTVICQNFTAHYDVDDASGHIYNWTVNGGSIVAGQNTNAIDIHWDQSGQGGITIEESSDAGCKANAFLNVKINAMPVPDFIADPVCEGQIMAFINKTTNGFQYNWEFGDGANSNDDNAFHRYLQAGNYIVHLNAFSSNGCTQSIQKNVQVVKMPTALFEVKNVCQGTPSIFYNQCKNSNDYHWDFGDGQMSTDSGPVHIYSKPGVYHVNLIASAPSGCNSNITLDAIVNPHPDANMIISRDKNVYQFVAQDSSETYFHWNFGDGNKSDLLLAKHEYTTEGLYKIHLDVVNGFDCIASMDTTIDFKYMLCRPEVYPNPFGANFNISYCLSARSHLRMVLIDQLGQPIKVFETNQDAGTYNSNLNTADLSLHNGAYIMQLWVNDNLYTQKLIHIR